MGQGQRDFRGPGAPQSEEADLLPLGWGGGGHGRRRTVGVEVARIFPACSALPSASSLSQ